MDATGKALWSWDLHHEPIKTELGEVIGCVALRANGTLLLALEDSGICAYDPRTRAKAGHAAAPPAAAAAAAAGGGRAPPPTAPTLPRIRAWRTIPCSKHHRVAFDSRYESWQMC
jgi:hypothetical protein